jgi:outer membrane protein
MSEISSVGSLLLRKSVLTLIALYGIGTGPVAKADTLREALTKAYTGNPTLTGARAQQRSTDATVAIARAAGMPTASVTATYNEFGIRSFNNIRSSREGTANLQMSVPLYSGGAVRNDIKAAETRVTAGVAQLRSTEATVFVRTVTAYMDVIHNDGVVELSRYQVEVLKDNLKYSRAGFKAGELTKTDIQQSEARLNGAQAQLETAIAQADSSREAYLHVIGVAPGMLEAPPPLPPLPATMDEAVEYGVSHNPDLLAASQIVRATGYDVRVAAASRYPKISAVASGSYTDYFGSLDTQGFRQTDRNMQGGVQLSLPLYQGGLPTARVRQAQGNQSAAMEQYVDTERTVVESIRSNFSNYLSALGAISAQQRAVESNKKALEGVKIEQRDGARSVLDVLNAEQELTNSQISVLNVQRDAYVYGFTLIAALGQAEAKNLGLDGGPLYDPTIHYRRVRSAISDFGSDDKPAPVAKLTYDIPMTSVRNSQYSALLVPDESEK